MRNSNNINWLYPDEIELIIKALQAKYNDDAINIISYNPIGYVCNLESVSNFYDDDLIILASVICRSIIKLLN